MTSSKEHLEHVLDLFPKVTGTTHRTMMGEYLLCSEGVLFGGIYDGKFPLKDVPAACEVFPLRQESYEGTRPVLLVDSEDPVQTSDTVVTTTPQPATSGMRKRRK